MKKGQRYKADNDIKDSFLMVKMTEEEKEKIRDYAKSKGMGMSVFVRMTLSEAVKKGSD